MNPRNVHQLIIWVLFLIIGLLCVRLSIIPILFKGSDSDKVKPINHEDAMNPTLEKFVETKFFPIPVHAPVAMEVVENGILIAGGDELIRINDDGETVLKISLSDHISAITVDEQKHIYVSSENKIYRYDENGTLLQSIDIPIREHLITAIAVSDSDVFLADSYSKQVLRLSLQGELKSTVGGPKAQGDFSGFVVPSPFFDLNLDHFGNLWVANPGKHLLQHFDVEGDLVSSWGKGSYQVDGFCGCCNPTRFIILPDGSFVTSEKGVVRVKIHRPDGTLESVVAGPDDFDANTVGLDLGFSASGAIVVMDPERKLIRIYERKFYEGA